MTRRRWARVAAVLLTCVASTTSPTASAAPSTPPTAVASMPVIVDLDIGDDIDDAFALALALASPELDLLGFTTAWGDTALRAKLLDRFLTETGHGQLTIAIGQPTASTTAFTQSRYAERGHALPGATSAVDFILKTARARPGRVTLIALAPLTNLAAAFDRDPATFRQLKRIVLMGGSVRQGYGRSRYDAPRPPDAEYNIVSDPAAAAKVFASGVPITMMPLDSTRLRFGEIERQVLFSHGSPTSDALGLLYLQWAAAYQPWASQTPTLFDVVPIAALVDPTTCPTMPLRIEVDTDGRTREVAGPPNADVCLASDGTRIVDLMMRRLLAPVAGR